MAALIAGWAAAIAVVAALVLAGRNTALERGHRSSAALAQIVEEHTARTFQAVTLTLGAVDDAWHLSRPAKNDPAFQELLRQRLQELPYVRALFVIGPDGFLIHDSDYPRTPDVSLADREYFRIHEQDPLVRRAVSRPLMSRSPGTGWFVSVTERLGRSARFEGVIVAAIEPAYFETLYRKLELGEDEAIALFHRDGTLIARHPAGGEEIGKAFSTLPLFKEHLGAAPSGTYATGASMFAGMQIVGYRTVEGLPMVVRVSRSQRAILGAWRRGALGAAVAMSALTVLLGGVLVQQMRRRRRHEHERARRAQSEKLEAMGKLTSGISHDFNNLLSVILLNMEQILRKPDDAQGVVRSANTARRAAERGAALVRRLLAFARQQRLEVKAADLNSLVTEAHSLVAQAAGQRIELVMQLAPALSPVLADETQFEVALLNLVVNARDAMNGRGRIVLRTHAADSGQPCLSVEDDGPGMSADTLRRALEPFFTTKGTGGTGLGLAQVYGFMQQIGGDLRLESSLGEGTQVHLLFPRAPVSPKAQSAAVTPR